VRQLDANVEGVSSYAALVQGTDGKFYGSTTRGLAFIPGPGFNANGTIFRMMLDGSVTVLHAFDGGQDGYSPYGALARASDGNFYGTTTFGGVKYGGTIFRITPTGTFTVLYSLDTSTEGAMSEATLLQAADGNLYGVTSQGGVPGTATKGAIFQTTLSGKVAVLHAFSGGPDGANPVGGLIQTADGTLYGTARAGAAGVGVVFRLRVTPQAPVIVIQPSNRSVKAGRPAVFTVAATGLPAPTYQWQLSTNAGSSWTGLTNTVPYSGTTTATLVVTSARFGLTGFQYRCVVTNSAGSTTSAAATLTVVALSDDLVVDFGSAFGLWLKNPNTGTWAQFHTLGAKNIVTGDLDGNGVDEVIVDFGSQFGIWVWVNNSNWIHLHASTANRMVTGDLDGNGNAELLVDFPGLGIWVWSNNTSWSQLHRSNSNNMVTVDLDGDGMKEAVIDFPALGIWVWQNNRFWFQLHPVNSRLMTVGDFDGNGQADLIVDFAGFGIWKYSNNRAWSQVHAANASHMAAGDVDGDGTSDLIVDFGSPYGIWMLMNGTTWSQLHTLTSTNIVTADLDANGKAEILVNFGAAGLWEYANNTNWVQLHTVSPGVIAIGHINLP
jgi:uncharacterized repeat protein (TIGR03803 family)